MKKNNQLIFAVGILLTLSFAAAGQAPVDAKKELVAAAAPSVPVDVADLGGSKAVRMPTSVVKKQATSSTFTWTGSYIGGHVGYGWGNGDTRFEPLPSASAFINMQPVTIQAKPRGVFGGAHGGYNWQSGSFVGGFETSISFSNIKGTKTVNPIVQNNGTPFPGAGFQSTTIDIDYLGTVRGRVGGAWDRVFIYGTAGLAFGKVNYAATTDFRPFGTVQYPAAISRTRTGWLGGFGADVAIDDHWSFRGEYLYFDLGTVSTTANPTPALPPFQIMYTWQTKFHTFGSGFSYRW